MTPANLLLRSVGEALYGPRWQAELARDLRMSDRHMRRLAAGTADLTPSMAEELIGLCEERASYLNKINNALSAYIAEHRPGVHQ